MNKTGMLLLMAVVAMVQVRAQTNDSGAALTLSGYLETYYGNDFNTGGNHHRPHFMYSYNRRNEFAPNLVMLKMAYAEKNIRAGIALAAGTYMNSNLAAEPGVLKNIFEAYAGVKLSTTKNLWLDAGIFSSHIGFESAIGKDCRNLTRSMLADNSPYYESGVKISYTSADEKWFISGLLLNGWQRIQRVPGNNSIALGHQLTFKPDSSILLNSSSFIGNDQPDSTRQLRWFHNLYGLFQLSKRFSLTTGFDIGAQQQLPGSSKYVYWYSPVVIAQWKCNDRASIAGRIEYYSDAGGVIIKTATPNGFKTWGYSINYDLALHPKALWRIEARQFSSEDHIFTGNNGPVNNRLMITTSLAISF